SLAPAGDPRGGHRRGRCGQPAWARLAFAVLCGLPGLRPAVLRGPGTDLGLSGADAQRCHGGLRRAGVASAEWTREPVVALHAVGRTGVGALQGHQPWSAKSPQRRHPVGRCTARTDLNTPRIAGGRGAGIAPRAARILPGHLRSPPQGRRVLLASVWLPGAWGVYNRRRWGQEDATGAESAIVEAVSRVGSLLAIGRPWLDVSGEALLEIIAEEGGGSSLPPWFSGGKHLRHWGGTGQPHTPYQ